MRTGTGKGVTLRPWPLNSLQGQAKAGRRAEGQKDKSRPEGIGSQVIFEFSAVIKSYKNKLAEREKLSGNHETSTTFFTEDTETENSQRNYRFNFEINEELPRSAMSESSLNKIILAYILEG